MMQATEDAIAGMDERFQEDARTVIERFEITEQSAAALFLSDAAHGGKFGDALAALAKFRENQPHLTGGDLFDLYRRVGVNPQ